jgi:rhodanese-related sulfurtransferase
MIPKRSISDIRSQIEADTTVFVDARFAHDYQKGHLPNAFNLPIDASDEERALVLARLPKDREIVIYCQSAGCTFAKVVANGLIRDGFTQVALFPGGWLDWKSASISPLRMQAHSPDEHR